MPVSQKLKKELTPTFRSAVTIPSCWEVGSFSQKKSEAHEDKLSTSTNSLCLTQLGRGPGHFFFLNMLFVHDEVDLLRAKT